MHGTPPDPPAPLRAGRGSLPEHAVLSAPWVGIAALFCSFAFLCLGHSLHSGLIPVRASLDGYPDWLTGALMSAYFAGFIGGTVVCGPLIQRVGHIRTFAAFASLTSAIALVHALLPNPWVWMLLRVMYGVSIAALYMVTESWLNAEATRATRGKLLSIYMTINLLGLSAGLLLLFVAEPDSYVLFAVVSILMSLALIPLLLGNSRQPVCQVHMPVLRLRTLWRTSPLGCYGTVITGLVGGAMWGLLAPYVTARGLPANAAALFLSLGFLGGLLAQWPLGALSDRISRRLVIGLCSGLGGAVSLGLVLWPEVLTATPARLAFSGMALGACVHPLYALCIAHVNDYLEEHLFVRASGSLLLLHGCGAIGGPLLAGGIMQVAGPDGLFLYQMVILFSLCAYAFLRFSVNRPIPEATRSAFVPLPKTGSLAFRLAAHRRRK